MLPIVLQLYSKIVYIRYSTHVDLFRSNYNGDIHVRYISVSPKKRSRNYGTKSMLLLQKIARKYSSDIIVMPHEIDTTPIQGVLNFYNKLGFKRASYGYYRWEHTS